MAAEDQRKYWLVSRRVRWGLTFWGWLFIFSLIILAGYLLFTRLYPFLSPTDRVNAGILVVEGSVPDYVLDSAMREYRKGNYRLLITTGTPLEWGHLLVAYENTAELTAMTLKKMGFDSTVLIAVSTSEVINDRTYNCALELKSYLFRFHPEVKAVNLMSYGPHARRSRMMFQAALGDSVRVGIISVDSYYYKADNWWKTGKGFREVLNEAFAYLFVKFFFRPYEKSDEP